MEKKTKITILSVFLAISIILSPVVGIQNSSLYAVLVASAVYFGLYWILEFNVVGLRLIFVFLLPVLFNFLFVQRFLGSFSEIGELAKLLIAVLFGVLNYVFILTANILNVASVKKIPLLQVAQTSLYFFTVFTSFLLFDALQSFGFGTILDFFVLLIVLFVLVYQLLWFMLDSRLMLFNITVLIDLTIVLSYFVLSFLPIPFLLLNLILSAILYVLCGLVMHSVKKSLSSSTMWEYVIVLLLVLLLAIISLDWGSFGALFRLF